MEATGKIKSNNVTVAKSNERGRTIPDFTAGHSSQRLGKNPVIHKTYVKEAGFFAKALYSQPFSQTSNLKFIRVLGTLTLAAENKEQ